VASVYKITGAQLELGDKATDFEMVDQATQFMRCQRYFERIKADARTKIGNGVLTQQDQFYSTMFFTEKRVPPNVTISNQANSLICSDATVNVFSTAVTFTNIGYKSYMSLITVPSLDAAKIGNGTVVTLEQDDYIDFDAEIY